MFGADLQRRCGEKSMKSPHSTAASAALTVTAASGRGGCTFCSNGVLQDENAQYDSIEDRTEPASPAKSPVPNVILPISGAYTSTYAKLNCLREMYRIRTRLRPMWWDCVVGTAAGTVCRRRCWMLR